MDDHSLLEQFENGSFPADQWHHREHIKVAYLYLRRDGFDAAVVRMRSSLKHYASVLGTPVDILDRGYHETMTLAWMRLVEFALKEYGPAENADQFYELHPELWQGKVLRFFYSHDCLLSWEAKQKFVEPDLVPLPRPRNH